MKRFISSLLLLALSSLSLAHTPVCRCQLDGQQVNCKGGYHDSSKAPGVTMVVIAYDGATLLSGELDETSHFSFLLPAQAFYVLMDAGPGEMFEVDWTDIEGVKKDIFWAEVR